ncbi:hypothetical protein QYE76_018166 [Lolium multiflorum]|uniref:CCHC-type domain-containing protein n=1 Tax=Lolium multiflorum TaxID=4521 RepID=A0AAD8UWY6_LOLMU|nr:hypothetical protein QYE76_018166 [Lolium multiflorum]
MARFLAVTSRGVRVGGSSGPSGRKFRPDPFLWALEGILAASGRKFRPLGAEVPVGRKFRPSGAEVPAWSVQLLFLLLFHASVTSALRPRVSVASSLPSVLVVEFLSSRHDGNREEDGELAIVTWRTMKAAMRARFVPTNYLRSVFDKLTQLKQGVLTVDAYYMEMEMLMQRARVRESLEMTMQRFLNGLKFNIKGIVRHHKYATMNELLHHAREAESQLAEEAQQRGRATGAGRYTPRPPPSTAPSTRPTDVPSSSSKPVSNVSHTKKPVPAASGTGSSMSTARNRDMLCHTCGGKGHFKKDCPNRKVMIINEDNEYETGDDADPDAPEDDDYDSDSFDAYPSEAQTIVVSQRVLNVQPSASTQRCNLFQTKALVGPDKACKVIIDGGKHRVMCHDGLPSTVGPAMAL